MSRPLYRGFSGSSGRLPGGNGIGDSLNKSYRLKDFSEIGFGRELLIPFGTGKSRRSLALCLLKLGVAIVIFLAHLGSLFWILCISTSSEAVLYKGYRRLQEQLVADLSVVGELSRGIGKLKELEFCPHVYENYVPCYFNISESSNSAELDGKVEKERGCVHRSAKEQACLILPPRNYKVPLRWPTGRDFIWKYNVKITGQELSSGSLMKRYNLFFFFNYFFSFGSRLHVCAS